MSNLTVNKLTALNPTTNLITLETGDIVYSPGSVVQVVQTVLMTPTAVSIPANSTSFTNIPEFFATISPKKDTSKIYISVRWFGESSIQTANWDTMMGVKRNGSAVGYNIYNAGGPVGSAMPSLTYYSNDANSTPEQCYFDYLDSPGTTSQLTYQVYANCAAAITLYTNRTVSASGADKEFGTSTITLWEIAQ